MRLQLAVLISLLILFSRDGNSQINRIEERFGVTVKLDTGFADSWEAISYQKLEHEANLNDFAQLIVQEFGKYPSGYFKKIGIDTIIICQKLHFERQERAAIPDPEMKTLLLDGNYSKYKKEHLTQVMHHELHHCTEFAIWGSTYYEWEEWTALNPENFLYGKRGIRTYLVENPSKDYYSMSHPKPGFCNPFQMLGEEQDRCEIMAFIFSDHRWDEFVELLKADPIILQKAKMMVQLMNDFWGTEGAYWSRQMSVYQE